ncbi:MAG TPA: aminotransferase class III-fold pyridoxal phosphate-dependent enzyme [Polyangiales bacterium]
MTQTQALMQFSERPPPTMVRGEGIYLWDEQDRRYLDLVQGWAVNCLGHSPRVIADALAAQATRVLNVGPAYHNQPAHWLATRLSALSGLSRVCFACSGAEANEVALKLARKWGQLHRSGAFEVLTTRDSFHGRTLALTSATGKASFEGAFPPAVPGFRKVPYDDLEAMEAAISGDTVAVMVEPIQGEAGVVVPTPGYLRGLRALCDRKGILLIADEIQTGMGRTGPLFAHQSEAVRPDIMTLGKGLGAGVPVSALLCRAELDCFAPGDHGGTFAGHALLCSVGLAVVEALTEPGAALERERTAQAFEQLLHRLAAKHGLGVRGRGFLWALVLPQPRAAHVRDKAFERGLLLNAARPDVLRLMPPLNLERAQLQQIEQLLTAVL